MKLYAVSMFAKKYLDGFISTAHASAVLTAANKDEATGKALAQCRRTFDEGEFHSHSVSVCQVPQSMIDEVTA